MRLITCIIFLVGSVNLYAQTSELKFTGVKIFVTDLKIAEDFYSRILGFKVSGQTESQLELETNTWPITLALASEMAAPGYPANARTGLSLQTHKLLPQIDAFREKGVKLHDSRLSRNGVGISIPFEDPFGNVMTIIEIQIREVVKFEGVKIYNTGVAIPNMDAATAFYEGILGYEEWSRDYLPAALPLKHSDGSFAFMIHYEKGLAKNANTYKKNSQIVLLMSTPNLESVKSGLNKESIVESKKGFLVLRDPERNLVEVTESSKP
ncbi:MAG: VOC family protein [Cyclobacteriaceae bacterium]